MVYDFRLDDARLFETLRSMARAGGMLEVHCEDPVLIDAAVAAALQRGDTLPRYHATTRRPEAEAVATHRAMEFARAADAPVHVVHLSSSLALEEVRRAKAAGVRRRPRHAPITSLSPTIATRARLTRRSATSSRRRSARRRIATRCGPASPTARSISSPPTTYRIGLLSRSGSRRHRSPTSATAPRGSRRCSPSCTARAWPGVGSPSSGWSTCSRRRRLADSGWRGRGRSSPGSTPISCSSTRPRSDDLAAADLHHTSDYTPYEGFSVQGAVRSVYSRGRAVVREGAFVGQRGRGRFVERAIAR